MSAIFTPSVDGLNAVREHLTTPEARRKLGACTIALVLHVLVFWALLVLPPALLPQVERVAQVIQVQLYTVSGGASAESDAPLFEPPLAGGADGVEGGASTGTSTGPTVEDIASDPVDATEPDPDTVVSEPVEDEPAAELIALEPDESAVDAVERAPVPEVAPFANSEPQTPRPAGPLASAPPLPPPASVDETRGEGPIATTQPRTEPGPSPSPRSDGPPTFADILARAGAELDPDDYRLLANFGDGVDETIRENFCLSSSDANREAMDCPEGSHLAAARLAQYGLMGLGEEAPEFLEDMDRLAFQLSTLGANDSQLTRILTSVREARREAINSGPLARQMARDGRDENGNDVPGAP